VMREPIDGCQRSRPIHRRVGWRWSGGISDLVFAERSGKRRVPGTTYQSAPFPVLFTKCAKCREWSAANYSKKSAVSMLREQ
jgi:hypothetical protein